MSASQHYDRVLAAATCNLVVADSADKPQKLAFFHNRTLLEIWHKPEESVIGQIIWARVSQIFPQHRRANIILHDGRPASLRMPVSAKLQSGQLVIVTLTAEAYADKPAQAILGAEIAGAFSIIKLQGSGVVRTSFKQSEKPDEGRHNTIDILQKSLPDKLDLVLRRRASLAEDDVIAKEVSTLVALAEEVAPALHTTPSEPSCIFNGVPALMRAKLQAPEADNIIDATHDLWDLAAEQSEAACREVVTTQSGIALWFSQTKALVAVDVDSAASKLSAEALVIEACAVLMQQITLRQYAGIILFDLPRLSRSGQNMAKALLDRLAEIAPRHPDILGFGPAGLMELRVRHTRTPLRDVQAFAEL